MSQPPEQTSSASAEVPTISRKERDRMLREQDFLDAAERLFSAKGYFETSMEDVAKEAEYATGTIYRYFDSKEALYHKLLLRKGEAYFKHIEALLSDPAAPRIQLERVTREKIDFFFTNAAFMRIYLNEVARPQQGKRCGPPDELKAHFECYLDRLRGILQRGMDEGSFHQSDVDLTLTAWIGITNELLSSNLERETPRSREDIEQYLGQFFNQGLYR